MRDGPTANEERMSPLGTMELANNLTNDAKDNEIYLLYYSPRSDLMTKKKH